MTAAITSYVYRGVEAQRSQIRQAFSQYLSPAVIQEIIADPDRLKLGGEERDLTLMFCDVRNFTSISQDLSAVDLTQFINELLSPLTEIILEQRGTIDKYMGDAIMAFWNAPLDDPEHTTHACHAALKMVAKMDELNETWRQRAEAEQRPFKRVNIGMGINTGQCCVGNLGSTYRFDYSAIGDDVNITSRFRGAHKSVRCAGHRWPALSRARHRRARIGQGCGQRANATLPKSIPSSKCLAAKGPSSNLERKARSFSRGLPSIRSGMLPSV